MWIFDVLTIIFIVLKMTGVIAWPWLAVFSPTIIGIVLYTLIKIHLMPRG